MKHALATPAVKPWPAAWPDWTWLLPAAILAAPHGGTSAPVGGEPRGPGRAAAVTPRVPF